MGRLISARRFASVEPFYNGQARVERLDGGLEAIDEKGNRSFACVGRGMPPGAVDGIVRVAARTRDNALSWTDKQGNKVARGLGGIGVRIWERCGLARPSATGCG